MQNQGSNPELEKKYFCSEHGIDAMSAKAVQKKYNKEYYLVYLCPICSKLLPIFATCNSEWKDVPIDESVADEALKYLEYVINWT